MLYVPFFPSLELGVELTSMIATDSEWAQFVGAVLSTEEQENRVQPMYQRVQVRHPFISHP
jgi:hypothetical protein